MENIDVSMTRLCNRLMGAEQQALDTLTYALDEMEYQAEQHPDRDDIRNCIEEIKNKIKADEAEHWAIANRWGEHFDGIAPDESDSDDESDEVDDSGAGDDSD
jgi:hypothetical protein